MVKIHQFDPVLYPMKLWIAVGKDAKGIVERFVDAETKKDISITAIETYEAVTCYVQLKEAPTYYGVLIASISKQYFTIKNIAHEATHAAKFMWQHMGERIPGEEAEAYLVGWVAECCEKVKLNKA